MKVNLVIVIYWHSDVTAKEFELLCGKKLGPEKDDAVTDDETGSEWEEAEL